MILRLLTALLSPVLLFSACATTHPGNEGHSLSPKPTLPLIISAETLDKTTNTPFQFIELTFENTAPDWVKIAHSRVVIDNPMTAKVSVVLGQDLLDWAEATRLKKNEDTYNQNLALAALIVTGSAAAIHGMKHSDDNLKDLGAAAAAGGYLAYGANELTEAYRSAIHVPEVPRTHFYHPFSVPGNMHLRKWVLFNKPVDKEISTLVIELETVEGIKERYAIRL